MSFALAAGATAPHASNASAGIVNGRRRSGVTAALAPTGVKLSRGSVRFGGDARALLVRKGVPAKPVSRDVKVRERAGERAMRRSSDLVLSVFFFFF